NFLHTIAEHNMFSRGDSVLIALSGGIDSTVMTHLMNALREKYDLTLYAFHLNHKLRADEADREAEFVKKLCNELRIEAFIEEYDVATYAKEHGLSIQVAARDIRYERLNAIRTEKSIDKIATAHNADDRVETVLIRLIRGTAGANISGISPVRDGHIIRPLINSFRKEIAAFSTENKITYMEDSSNAKTTYLRNRVRHMLVPYLRERFNENIEESILNFARVMKPESDYLKKCADEVFSEEVTESSDGALAFSIKRLKDIDEALRSRIITTAFYKTAPATNPLTYKHVTKVDEIIVSDKPNMSYDLPGGVTLKKSYDKLMFTRTVPPLAQDYEYEHNLNDATYIKEAQVTIRSEVVSAEDALDLIKNKKANEEFVDTSALIFPINIRNFHTGDVITPLNLNGTKKVKDIFINKKITIDKRRTTPILVSNGVIFSIPTITLAETVKVTKGCKNVVKFTMK
ncbi:tRNA lysidine(34) synthetase TilS, partial [Thermodesulfobacteriota bacterium]